MWIIALLLDMILGVLIIGDPIMQLIGSPVYLSMGGVICVAGYCFGELASSKDKILKFIGIGMLIILILNVITFILSSGYRELIYGLIRVSPPEISFRSVSSFQWTIWIIAGCVINSLILPTPSHKDSEFATTDSETNNEKPEENEAER